MGRISLAVVALAAAFTVTATTGAFAGEWVDCAREGEYCTLPSADLKIRYGNPGFNRRIDEDPGGRWSDEKTLASLDNVDPDDAAASKFVCANAVFGDPAPMSLKSCQYYKVTEVWKHCADEGGRCAPPQNAIKVRFGLGYSWKVKNNVDPVICSVAKFGDPQWGMRKSCQYAVME